MAAVEVAEAEAEDDKAEEVGAAADTTVVAEVTVAAKKIQVASSMVTFPN